MIKPLLPLPSTLIINNSEDPINYNRLNEDIINSKSIINSFLVGNKIGQSTLIIGIATGIAIVIGAFIYTV